MNLINTKPDKVNLRLKKLSAGDGRDIYDMLQSMPKDENGLVNKANGFSYEDFKTWLAAKQKESEQTCLVDGWKVPSTTYWLYADTFPVGFGNLRHFLTQALSNAGGHIGYGIAPQYRGKGYGKELLRLLLIEAKKIGLEKVLITIHSDNIASQKVALANGGVITEKTEERVYIWIESSSIKDYERLTATKTLFTELKKGEDSAAKNGWLDPSDVRKMAGL